MADKILFLPVPHSARLSSMRARALTLCSYIEGVTGSGATATVNTRSSWTTARLRVGVRPGKRSIMSVCLLAWLSFVAGWPQQATAMSKGQTDRRADKYAHRLSCVAAVTSTLVAAAQRNRTDRDSDETCRARRFAGVVNR